MCSPPFFNVIRDLESLLQCGFSESTGVNSFKVYKVSKDHRMADYICNVNDRQRASEYSRMWELKCIERMPWIKDYIQVTVAPHGFNVNLSRKIFFQKGMIDVREMKDNYGHSQPFKGKIFDLLITETKDPSCPTNLRISRVSDVIGKLILVFGGSLCSYQNADPNASKIHISYKNEPPGVFANITVGPVICRSTSGNVDSQSYQRLRLADISSMCESKLDLNSEATPEEKDKLLNAAILFDLLQSSIWRSVTLHVSSEAKDEKSTCKGSMFVIYNYARLHTLCAQFEERVLSKIFPPLPPLEEIDFGLLSQQEEWTLMFQSVLSWPLVLAKAMQDLESGKPKIHLIFEFLKTTAVNFSHYYHRVRIFTDPKSHLLPVLFARMHLLQSLLIVFDRAFEVVGITPLKKM